MLGKKSPITILGNHPKDGWASLLSSSDYSTQTNVPLRVLAEVSGQRNALVSCFRDILVQHHVGPDALARDKARHDALRNLGITDERFFSKRFPTNPLTRKGNLAEAVLADYLVLSSEVAIPVYRLRYNPNIEQSMKGDDVLAFDLDSDPVRLIVGESKFRSQSSKAAITEMLEGLVRSHKGGVPASLQFVADRLFEMGNIELGSKVMECATLFALDKLQIDYVGLMMSDERSAQRFDQYTENCLRRLAIISFGLDSPDSIVDSCYDCLESHS
jgi:hypothetical protein